MDKEMIFSKNLGAGIVNHYMTLVLIVDISIKNSLSRMFDDMGIDIVFGIKDFKVFDCDRTANYLKNIKILNLSKEAPSPLPSPARGEGG